MQMQQQFSQAFYAILQGDNASRKKAERDLQENRDRGGTCEALCDLILDASEDPSVRQLGVITLKNWISSGWEYPRELVHSSFLNLLCDPSAGELTLRTCGVAIAKTAIIDFPDNWGSLLDDVASLLTTDSSKYAILCICCLTEELSGAQLERLGVFVPHLLQYATEVDTSRAALVLKAVDALCLALGVNHPEIKDSLSEAFPLIKEQAFTQVNDSNIGVVLQSMHIVKKLFDEFSSLWDRDTLDKLLWLLGEERDLFQELVVAESDDEEATIGLSKVVAQRLNLLLSAIRKKKVARFCKEAFEEHGYDLAEVLLGYSMISHTNECDWVSDANTFHKQEEDRIDAMSWAPRDIAADCIQNLARRMGDNFIHPLLQKTHEVLSEELSAANWKMREAVLFALAHTIESRMTELTASGIPEGFPQLVGMLVEHDLGGNAPTLLACRALLLIRTLVKHAKSSFDPATLSQITTTLLPACLDTLRSDELLLSSSSCVLLVGLIRRTLSEEDFRNAHNDALLALVSMARQPQIQGENLYLCLDALCCWLKKVLPLHPDCKEVPHAVLEIWSTHIQDPNVSDYIKDIFFALLAQSGVYESIIAETLPSMAQILQGHTSMAELCCIPTLLSIIRKMVGSGSLDLVEALRQNVLGLMCQLVLTNEDTGIAKEALEVLALLLQRVGTDIAEATVDVIPSAIRRAFGEADGGDGDLSDLDLPMLDEVPEATPLPTVLLAVASLIVGPGRNELFLLNAGSFLRAIAVILPPCLSHDDMTGFVCRVANRALTVRMDTALQELMLPLAALINSHGVAVVDVLGDMRNPLLEQWVSRQKYFDGIQAIMETGKALLKLLEEYPDELRHDTIMLQAADGKRNRRVPISVDAALFVGAGRALLQAIAEKDAFCEDFDDDVANAVGDMSDVEDEHGGSDADDFKEDQADDIVEDDDEAFIDPGAQALEEFLRLRPFVDGLAASSLEFFKATEQKKLQEFLQQ